jgi:flagellar hook protein FlgE
MGSSLFAGVSGLNASSKQMDVIGNNIANVNTIGYRSAKIQFGDLLSQSIAGGASSFIQVGRGVSVSSIDTQFSSGSFETTANATDLAIDGSGFFMVNDGDGGKCYTRAGAFHLDSDGYLVDVNDYKVQGYSFFGSDPNTITDISLQAAQSDAEATSSVSIGVNLDAEAAAGSTFNAAQTVYDSLGATHTLNTAFQKTEGSGYWGFQAYLDNEATTSQPYSGLKFDSNGALDKVYASSIGTPAITTAGDGVASAVVNNEGQLYGDASDIVLTRGISENVWTIDDNGGYLNMSLSLGTGDKDDEVAIDLDGAGGADITFALSDTWAENDSITFSITQTEINAADISLTFPPLTTGATIGSSDVITWDLAGDSADMITGYAGSSVVKSLTADGYSSGILKDLSITQEGVLSGSFTNGQTAGIGQIVLADFSNPSGLRRMGKNLFGETITSGSAVQNIPGTAGMGEINPNSLEMSNTDIATEFINMITAQRAYQASAKVVTTTDAMMSELMNLKR